MFSSTLIYLSFPPAQLQVDWDFYYTFRIISMNKKIKLTVLLNDNCFHLILLTFFKYLSEQFHPISLASFSISGHLFSFILSSSWFFFGFFIRWFSFRWIFSLPFVLSLWKEAASASASARKIRGSSRKKFQNSRQSCLSDLFAARSQQHTLNDALKDCLMCKN